MSDTTNKTKTTKAKPRVHTNTLSCVERLTLPDDDHNLLRILLNGGAPYRTGVALQTLVDKVGQWAKYTEAHYGADMVRLIRYARDLKARGCAHATSSRPPSCPGGLVDNVTLHVMRLEAEGFVRLENQKRVNAEGQDVMVPWLFPFPVEGWRSDHFMTALALRLDAPSTRRPTPDGTGTVSDVHDQ